MAGKYRLLALDLDGTTLNDRSEISAVNEEWIRRASEAGVAVCISTGRGFQSALPFAEQLKLDTPMITVNGGEIWSRPHELHQRTTLAREKIERLHQIAQRYPDVWFWAYSTEGIYNKDRWVEDTYAQEWLKFGYYTEDEEALGRILAEIREWEGLELSNSSPYNIEVNAQGVSKAAAIAEVCRLLGCSMTEAVAVGDSLNDLAAIKAVGLGVAMGNAQEEVKAAADVVTGGNLEDGVAQVIQQYVLRA
ncbi:Cof-type HAD-IIB family hydrolase [Cohnella lubricantis]|uniref:Cof-type HAD-IIB family hydrolase n=1 Tax=Cohnella lubricantis TaxID=2163172 RepID=UPI001FDAC4AD|nr:Cof-type HAD-IIB family hydrolase [Cohnella lubricantis]MBP2118485.1 HAD superfamily hydrolase (TIGR01484 family) [Cohnella lubricantis]